MIRRVANLLLGTIILLELSSAKGDIYLSSFYSQSVRNGYSAVTLVDSVMLDMRVNSGIAISKYTFVVTPYLTTKTLPVNPEFDSIEITLNFQLPPDFVADSMWLWIEGKPVEAQIQDRELALQQYTQIVGRRRDPALLQKNSAGNYSLRIFPAYSGKSRKIAIQFHHTFDDSTPSSENIVAVIPLYYDSSSVYIPIYSSEDTLLIQQKLILKTIKFFSATFTADDREEYNVNIPGIGSGTFYDSKALVIKANNVFTIRPGTVSCKDVSDKNEFCWIARDTNTSKMCAGISVKLSENSMYYEREPDTRIILLDIHKKIWNLDEYYKAYYEAQNIKYDVSSSQSIDIWDRAQKMAVLSLTQYLNDKHKFNVIIGGKEVNKVFSSPVEANKENIEKAVKSIVEASPDKASSTEELLKAAISQSNNGIVILITDLYQPPVYYTTQIVDGIKSTVISDDGKNYDSLLANLSRLVKSSDITLFTIADEYRLTQIALSSGGYNLNGLRYGENILYHYEVVNGKRIRIPELPALFGNYNTSGISNLRISSDKMEDIVYTIDNLYNDYYIMRGYISVGPTVSSKIIYQPQDITEILLSIAGKLTIEDSGKEISLNITGKNRGLKFKSEVKAKGNYTPVTSIYRPYIDPQWAFRKSEMLAVDNYPENSMEIKRIGKVYHIVTQRTSLLALEPGMKMWEDTVWQQAQDNSGDGRNVVAFDVTEGVVTSKLSITNSANTFLDTLTIADIMMSKDIMSVKNTKNKIEKISVWTKGNIITISLPSLQHSSLILRLYDLKGRLVAQKSLEYKEISNDVFNWNIGKLDKKISKGIYTVHISMGSMKKVFSLPLVGN